MTEYNAATDTYRSWLFGTSYKHDIHERNKLRSALVLGMIVLALLCGAPGCAERNDPTRTQIAESVER